MAYWYAAVQADERWTLGGTQLAAEGRIARMLFCVHQDRILMLSGFIKKSQKTPDEELALARKRMGEFVR